MSAAAFMRAAKLKGAGIIRAAAAHNLREIQAEQGASGPIDSTRSHFNQTLAGATTATGVDQHAKALMTEAGVAALRKDAVMALELVMSLPVTTNVDVQRYFADCLTWVKGYFACPVLSAVIHLDEAAAHCHILLLPLKDGRMVGNKLIGGRPQLLAMQGSFHEAVAAKHGLRKAPARLAGATKQSAASQVLARLRETGDSALSSDVWATIRGCIESGPERFLEALGMEVETKAKASRTMAQIFTSPGKGPKREVTKPSNAIAFDQPAKSAKAIAFKTKVNGVKSDLPKAIAFEKPAEPKEQRLCTVAFEKNPTVSAPKNGTHQACGTYRRLTAQPTGLFTRLIPGSRPTDPAKPAAPASGDDLSHLTTTRVKDDALTAGAWDADRGEFVALVTQTADTWTASHVASRTKAREPAMTAEPDDCYVERDGTYQPDFEESEVYPWAD